MAVGCPTESTRRLCPAVTAEICAEFAAVPSPTTSTVVLFGQALLAASPEVALEGLEQPRGRQCRLDSDGRMVFPRLELTPTRRQGKRLLIVRCFGMDVAPPAPVLPGGAEDQGALGTLTVSSRGTWIPLRKSR
jgi:hypothetical protein